MPLTSLLITAEVVLAAIVVGGVLVRSNLRPVRLLTDAVKHVVETKDFHPVTVPHATGEVARLASWFNHLLRMVARMRERQTRLVLDAGHELRNPLTSLRTNVDLLAVDLSSARLSPEQRSEIVGDVQAQLGELSGLVTDLTHLARDEDEVAPQPVELQRDSATMTSCVWETSARRVRPQPGPQPSWPLRATPPPCSTTSSARGCGPRRSP